MSGNDEPALGGRRRLGLVLLTAALACALLELLVWVVVSVREGGFSLAEVAAARREVAAGRFADETAALGGGAERLALHPHWGVLADRSADAEGSLAPELAIAPASEEELRVLLLGGSVAWQVLRLARPSLEALLTRYPGRERRRVVLLNGTGPAQKQPQQVAGLAYLLARGARFDAVVNLDGFNEIHLPQDLHAEGADPFEPVFWSLLAAARPDREELEALGRIELLRRIRRASAEAAELPPLRFSLTASALWMYADRALAARLLGARRALAQRALPAPDAPRDPLPIEELAALWERSSLAIQALSERFGFEYFHLLQPNQYVPGSKPMGEAERRRAYDAAGAIRARVEQGYPELQRRGAALRERGVRFIDLTRIFEHVEEPRYFDACCHLNEQGAVELAGAIGLALIEERRAALRGAGG